MTKSLGRTYSLLDFSGREMHYWPGNLSRHRRVDAPSPGPATCGVIARYTRLFSLQEDATCHPLPLPPSLRLLPPPVSLLISSSPRHPLPFRGTRLPASPAYSPSETPGDIAARALSRHHVPIVCHGRECRCQCERECEKSRERDSFAGRQLATSRKTK